MLISTKVSENKLGLLFSLIFLMVGLIWCSIIPIWEGFDEPAHYAYVQHLVENHEFPRGDKNFFSDEIMNTLTKVPINANIPMNCIICKHPEEAKTFPPKSYSAYWMTFNQTTYNENHNFLLEEDKSLRAKESVGGIKIWESQQAPLSYLLLSLFYKISEQNDIITTVFVLRYVGIAISAAAIYFVYKTVVLLSKNSFMRYGVMIFAVFNPMFVMNLSRISNEPLNFLFFSLFFYYAIKLLKDNFTFRRALVLGIIIGLGLLTKQSFIVPLVLVPAIIFLKVIQVENSHRKKIIHMISRSGFIIFTSLAISSWWYLQNLLRDGNISGIAGLKPIPFNNIAHIGSVNWLGYVEQLFLNFWGLFGWSFIRLPWLYYEIALVVSLASISGIGFFIFQNRTNIPNIIRKWRYQSIIVFSMVIILLILGMSYINFQYYLGTDKKYDLLFTGSWYTFAAASAVSILLIGGLRIWLDRFRINVVSKLPFFIMVLMVCLNFYALSVMTAFYYGA